MKRKLSVALVLAIVLALLTIGALAALLGSKEFVGNVLAPKAAVNASDKWTQEEVQEILRIAEENGIALSEENLARLQSGDGYFKEELMRLFAKVDLGFYPSTWSLEDQAWYDQLLVDCGLKEERSRFLPEAGEIGEEEALRIAIEHIKAQYDAEANVADERVYLRHVVYGLGADEAGNPIKRWDIEYMAQDLIHDSYVLTLTQQGELMEARVYPGIHLEGDAISTPEQVRDRYEQIYGNVFDWAPETWVALHDALEKAAATHGATGMLAYITHQQYGLPDAASMTREEAIEQANAALIRQGGVQADDINTQYGPPMTVYLMDGDTPVWKVRMFANNTSHLVELDAHSGELRSIAVPTMADRWYRSVVLESVYKMDLSARAIEPGTLVAASDTSYQWALENVKSVKTPGMWRNEAAPAFFWEEMESLGFGADTADALVVEWIDAYGPDMRFWPLAQRAIIHLWVYGLEAGNMTIQGLPAEGDIGQAQAEAIAWEAYRPLYEQKYGQEPPDAFVLSVHFMYNLYNRDDRVWQMEVIDPTRATGQGCGCVAIDAQTGEVLFAGADTGGNG